VQNPENKTLNIEINIVKRKELAILMIMKKYNKYKNI
jgi:hypothetical protein